MCLFQAEEQRHRRGTVVGASATGYANRQCGSGSLCPVCVQGKYLDFSHHFQDLADWFLWETQTPAWGSSDTPSGQCPCQGARSAGVRWDLGDAPAIKLTAGIGLSRDRRSAAPQVSQLCLAGIEAPGTGTRLMASTSLQHCCARHRRVAQRPLQEQQTAFWVSHLPAFGAASLKESLGGSPTRAEQSSPGWEEPCRPPAGGRLGPPGLNVCFLSPLPLPRGRAAPVQQQPFVQGSRLRQNAAQRTDAGSCALQLTKPQGFLYASTLNSSPISCPAQRNAAEHLLQLGKH